MLKHLLKLIWNKKKQNSLLISEMLISFLVIFAVFTFAVYAYRNYTEPMGMNYQHTWTVSYNNSLNTKNNDSLMLYYQTLKQNLKAMPQVVEASYTSSNTPFGTNHMSTNYKVKGKNVGADNFFVEDDYYKTLDIKLLGGRWYNKGDMPDRNNVIVVNKSFAEKAFGTANAVGKQIADYDEKHKIKVIGVLDDIKFNSEYQPAVPCVYQFADTASYHWLGKILIKVSPQADAAFESKLYKVITSHFKNANVEIERLSVKVHSANKFMLVPLIILGIVATFLIINVALGLFGVLWYNINKRRGEIGLRRAVGADGGKVSWQLVFEALILATFSLIVGSFFAIQFPLLNVFDLPSVVYLTALVLAIVFIYALVLICSLYPGKQAAAIYPAVALHEE